MAPTVPARILLDPTEDEALAVEGLIEDSVVFYGAFFHGAADAMNTPLHNDLPAVFLHAQTFDNLVTLGADAVRHVERDIECKLPEHYRSEVLPQLPYWIQAVGGLLRDGVMLFVDYGYPRSEYYRAARSDGTLRCFYRHRAHDDPFFLPGLQDLTASVDFTALAEAGVNAGFDFAGYCSQASFLTGNGLPQQLLEIEGIADEAEARYGRKVAWGVTLGDRRVLFTHLAVPVMTRLRQPERKVLDTLVDAGVARSRADALSWTVKLAGQHSEAWLAELRASRLTTLGTSPVA